MKTLLSALLMVCMSVSAHAESSTGIIGSWAKNQNDCKNPTDGNIRITKTTHYGHEQGCDVKHVSRTRKGWAFDLACGGEGETWDEKRELSLLPDGKLAEIVKGQVSTTWVRCIVEKPAPNWPQ